MTLDLKNSFEQENWAVLFGAGVSLDSPSNTPLGYNLVVALLQQVLHKEYLSKIDCLISGDIESLKIGKFLRFETLCEIIEMEASSLTFLDFFSEYIEPNINHVNLANLMLNSCILLTTNFDGLVELAASKSNINISQVVIPTENTLKIQNNILYKLHGTAFHLGKLDQLTSNNLLTTIKRISDPKSKKQIQEIIEEVSKNYNLLIVGYSGLDDFDVSPAIRTAKSDKKIVWFDHSCDTIGYKVYNFNQLKSITGSKAKQLIEDIYSLASRSPENIYFAKGNTSSLLSEIGGESYLKSTNIDSNIVDFKKHIFTWAESCIVDYQKTIITCNILIQLNKEKEALELLILDGVAHNALVENKHNVYQEKLVSLYMHCLTRNISARTNPDLIEHVINYLNNVKSQDVKFKLNNNIGIYYFYLGNLKEASKHFKIAIDIAEEICNYEYKTLSKLNYSNILDQAEISKYLEVFVLPDAKYYNYINLLAKIYFNLGILKNDNNDYFVKAIDNAILVGDYRIMLRSMLYVSVDNLHIYRKPLIRALNQREDEQVFCSSNINEGILFYGIISLYFSDTNYSLAESMALKASTMYSISDEYDINLHCSLCEAIFIIYDMQKKYRELVDFINTTFPDIDQITNESELLNILYYLSKSTYFIYNKKDEKNEYFIKLELIIQEKSDTCMYIHLQHYFYETGNYIKSIALADMISGNCTCHKTLYFSQELLGNCYFNTRRYEDAKKYYLDTFIYLKKGIEPSGAIFYNLTYICLRENKSKSSAIFFVISKFIQAHDKTMDTEKIEKK